MWQLQSLVIRQGSLLKKLPFSPAKLFVFIFTTLFTTMIFAAPEGGQVAAGQAIITHEGSTTQIQQSSQKAVIDWQSYNVAAHEKVNYQQPSTDSITLNRINPQQGPSSIFGQINANGQVWLVNPAGIWFGPSAHVDVGGLIATTSTINAQHFMNGHYQFTREPGWNGAIINEGQIIIHNAGLAALVGSGVVNNGLVQANLGTVILGATNEYTIDFRGDNLIHFVMADEISNMARDAQGNTLRHAVSNTGVIQAQAGKILLTTKTAGSILDKAINMNGIVEANSAKATGGEIILLANNGTVTVSGQINAAGIEQNTPGGKIKILGNKVALLNGAELNASGVLGGGEILIGGDFQGNNATILNAQRTYVDRLVNIFADATTQGNGGKVIVWADGDTRYYGNIFARGGSQAGNGGTVEISGKEVLAYDGQVDTSAAFGTLGTLLLDPKNIEIKINGALYSSGTNNTFANIPDSTTVIAPDSFNLVNANITLDANNDVIITDAINLTNSLRSITIRSGRSILVNADITTLNGNITLSANDANANVTYRDAGAGDIVMNSLSTLNAGTAQIQLTIGTLSGGTPGSITVQNLTNTNINPISVTSQNALILNGAITSGTGTITLRANQDSSGPDSFVMNAGSSVVTGNTTTSAVQISVNDVGTGTGGAALRSIQAGSGGRIFVETNRGSNTTGGSITQLSGTLNVGTAGSLQLRVPSSSTSGIGTALNNISTTSAGGVLTMHVGAGGAYISNMGDLTLSTSTYNPNPTLSIISSGTLTLPGSQLNMGTGSINFRSNGGTLATNGNLITSGQPISLFASGPLTIGHNLTSSNGAINLTGTNVSQSATSTVNAGSGTVTLNANTGTYTTISGAKIFTSGVINLIADNLTVVSGSQIGGTGTGSGFSSNIILEPSSNDRTIGIAGGSGNLNISTTVLSTLRASNLRLGNINSGAMEIATTGSPWTTPNTLALNGVITLASGAGITQNAAIDFKTNSNAKLLIRGAGNVALTNANNKFSSIAASKSAGSFSLTNAATNAITVDTATDDIGTVNGLTVPGVITLAASGVGGSIAVNQNIATTNNAINLTGIGINVASSKHINSGNGTITLNALDNTLQLNAGSLLLSSGTINLTADNLIFDTSGTPSQVGGTASGMSSATTVIVQPYTSSRTIGIAGGSGNLSLSAAALNDILATNVRIGNSTAGDIAINTWSPQATFASNGIVTLATAGTITQSGAINFSNNNASLLLRNASSVTLDSLTNSLSGISADVSGALSIKSDATSALTITTLTDDVGLVDGLTSTNTVTLQSLNNIILNAPISGTGATNAIVLSAQAFINNEGASALTPGSGRFLIWSINPNNNVLGGLTYNFKQYNATFGSSTVLGTSNGFLYSVTPILTVSLSGSTNKVYDANTTATLANNNYNILGVLDGDSITLNNPTSGTYNNKNIGTEKTVMANGISITSAANGAVTVYGYQLGSTSANGNIGIITAKAVNVENAIADNKFYDGNTTAVVNFQGAELSGVIAGDSVQLDSANYLANFTNNGPGTNIPIVVTNLSLVGIDATNYSLNALSNLEANIISSTPPVPLTPVSDNSQILNDAVSANELVIVESNNMNKKIVAIATENDKQSINELSGFLGSDCSSVTDTIFICTAN